MAASSSGEAPPAKRARLLSELKAHGGCTRTALAKILSSLHKEGVLHAGVGEGAHKTLRSRILDDTKANVERKTPYGSLIESMSVDAPGISSIEYVNPFAYLHLMSSKSKRFYDMCASVREARIVMYVDEICPGNPLRPDKSRTTQCVYWTVAGFPANILVQAGFWMLATVVRSSVVCKIPGGVSGLMRRIMHIWFGRSVPNFMTGVVLGHGTQSTLFRGCFSGFLADEKALKEIYGIKGASGSKPCLTCSNVVQFMEPEHVAGTNLVGINCRASHLLRYNTNATIYNMVDKLRQQKAIGTKIELTRMEQAFGMNYNEHNLLFDDSLRQVIKPVDHYLRDWMHTLMSGGIFGTQVARLLRIVKAAGIRLAQVGEYANPPGPCA